MLSQLIPQALVLQSSLTRNTPPSFTWVLLATSSAWRLSSPWGRMRTHSPVGPVNWIDVGAFVVVLQLLFQLTGFVFALEGANLHAPASALRDRRRRRQHFKFYFAVPGRHTSTAFAAASDRSTMRSSINGPRSVMRTTTECPVVYVGHAHHRVQRQRTVRRGHSVLIVDLAVRSAMMVVRRPVPTGQASLDVDRFAGRLVQCGTVVASLQRAVRAAGSAGAIVGGGGTGWLRAVLCPPQAESSSTGRSTTTSREAELACSAFLSACSNPSGRRPGSVFRWRCAAHCSSARESQAPASSLM